MVTLSKKGIVNRFNFAQDSLVIQAADMSLETVAAMVEKGAIDVQPQYQRRDRWPVDAQSALIESFLLNIPVPPVYLAEEKIGTYSVIDGKQRLTTIKRFMREEFSLIKLERFTELEGKKFSELPIELRNALEIRPYIRVVTLLKQSDPELKYEVFTRLNTGGIALQPQEVRNAMYRGPLNDAIIQLSGHSFLRKQLKIKTLKEDAYKSMSDVEYVLRFLNMKERWQTFTGDYRKSMDDFMRDYREASPAKLKVFASSFKVAIERCETLWGGTAFRRFDPTVKAHRDQFLSALYDAQMIAASNLKEADFKKISLRTRELNAKTKALFSDLAFDDSIRVSTNTPKRVRTRIEAVQNVLKSLV